MHISGDSNEKLRNELYFHSSRKTGLKDLKLFFSLNFTINLLLVFSDNSRAESRPHRQIKSARREAFKKANSLPQQADHGKKGLLIRLQQEREK